VLIGVVASLVGLSACSGAVGAGAPAPTYRADLSNEDQLSRLATTATLAGSDIAGWSSAMKERLDLVSYQLQQACGAAVDADAHIVKEVDHKWRQGTPRPVMDQSVFAYDQPVGAAGVDAARTSLTCRSYPSPIVDEGRLDVLGPFDVPGATAQMHTFGYCEQSPDTHATRCVVLVGVGQFACRLRVSNDDENQARQTAIALAPAVERRCQAAAAAVSSPTPSAS
jgi:hypothetical protein